MSWEADLLSLAQWALQLQDLRHRYLFAETPERVANTFGLALCLETMAVLAIYEAAIGKGYKREKTIGFEKPYPREYGKNPKRSDLAFKETGRGKNWAYVEVKYYGSAGKSLIECDIDKLSKIETPCQRWMLIYRIRPIEGKSLFLQSLLERNFGSSLSIFGTVKFPTITNEREEGCCEICLARI